MTKYTWRLVLSGAVMVGVAPEDVDQAESWKWTGWYVWDDTGTKYSYQASSVACDLKPFADGAVVTMILNGSVLSFSINGAAPIVAYNDVRRNINLRLAVKLKKKNHSARLKNIR